MEIVTREVVGRRGGVIDTGVEPEALMYVAPHLLMPFINLICYRSGIGIGTLVITEIGQGRGTGMTMGIARAAGIDPETDGGLAIEMP